jgi:hypothetical protein
VPGDTGGATVLLGSATAKGRVQVSSTGTTTGDVGLFSNRNWLGGNAQDNAAKPSWGLLLNASLDNVLLQRSPAGSTTQTILLQLDNAGNLNAPGSLALNPPTGAVQAGAYGYGATGGAFKGIQARGAPGAITPSLIGDVLGLFTGSGCASAGSNTGDQGIIRFLATENWTSTARGTRIDIFLTNNATSAIFNSHQFNQNGDIWIAGNNATKNAGSAWINPSDIRLKTDIAPYAHGLADILQLEPISYTLVTGEHKTCGLDAAKVQSIFPECVGTRRMKLAPDDEDETEVLTLDMHPILIALINAIRELNAKVG